MWSPLRVKCLELSDDLRGSAVQSDVDALAGASPLHRTSDVHARSSGAIQSCSSQVHVCSSRDSGALDEVGKTGECDEGGGDGEVLHVEFFSVDEDGG